MTPFKYYSNFPYIMKIKQLMKQLEKDNKEDLTQLNLTKKEYEKLKKSWLNKETVDFELIGQIELRKHIMRKLNNF